MIRPALLAAVVLAFAGHGVEAADLQLWIDPDGTTYLENTSDKALSFDGYQIVSESNLLDPVGWYSLADQVEADPLRCIAALGTGVLTFSEVGPSTSNLAEINPPGAATMQPGAKFAIGKPFGLGGYEAVFAVTYPGSEPPRPAEIVLVPRIPGPEPSTWLLATLAGLGLLASRARGLRVPARRPQ